MLEKLSFENLYGPKKTKMRYNECTPCKAYIKGECILEADYAENWGKFCQYYQGVKSMWNSYDWKYAKEQYLKNKGKTIF